MSSEISVCRHCGEPTQGGEYLPGHDSYHASELAKGVAAGEIDDAWARSQMPPGVLKQYEAWLPGKLAQVSGTTDDLEHQRDLRRLRDEALNTPNCPNCLHRMEPAEVSGEPVWRCTECRATVQP